MKSSALVAAAFFALFGDTVPTPSTTYDYIIVGSGAGGLPMADRLSASGKSVLLIERGGPSSYRWGGRRRGAWLQNSNVTRFDVPGLYNLIWSDNEGIKCKDVVPMAGCVLGGGTAINAGLFFKPDPEDWNVNYPAGWKAQDLAAATERTFAKVPWTDTPSQDGVLYNPQAKNLIEKGLAATGWRSVKANNVPGDKNRTFSASEYFFMHGERGGPMETYLVAAAARNNFKLVLNTAAVRLARKAGTVTGVEVASSGEGGLDGTINLKPGGRVILSAGVYGTAKILFRSGIGPKDQLQIVQKVDGAKLIDSKQWINVPVGYNLDDHGNTGINFEHPDIVYYDFNAAYDNPVKADAAKYLANRTGILTQAAPNINPIAWEGIKGKDGIDRFFQWTAYVDPPKTSSGWNSAGIAGAIGRGKTSRGRVTIDSNLNMSPSVVPFYNDPGNNDFEATVATVSNLVKAVKAIPGARLLQPAPGQDVRSYVQSMAVDAGRTANHWVGTARLGLDSGLQGGKSVVDLNAQVYGTTNLHIADASIINGITVANPQGAIMVASEKVSESILSLA